MAIKRQFVWAEDQDYGGTGWKPKGIPDFNVVSGPFIVHDVLEHFSPTDASLEAEFLAFGSILYLRAETEWWAHTNAYHTDPAEHMASDVYNFLADEYGKDSRLRSPGRTTRLEEDLEDILTRVGEKAMRLFHSEGRDITYGAMTSGINNAIAWMRKGYRKAAKRWNLDLNERIELLSNVTEAAERAGKYGDYGDILTVSVDKHTLKARAWVTHPYDNDDY
jgi:hypothetical protein